MMPRCDIAIHQVGNRPEAPAYTIASLVTDREQHAAMRASLISGGFSQTDCEFLAVDNSGPENVDAYRGLNALLNAARAPIVILCHQDIRLLADGRGDFDARLAELEGHDTTWAVAGNAGGISPGRLAIRISDPHGRDRHIGDLPARVQTLDENFLIVKRDARIGFSSDLGGFHFYGADICLHASQMGLASYVIDFHIEHLSAGRKDDGFFAAETAFRTKWSRALEPRWLQTTCALINLSGGPIARHVRNAVETPFEKLARFLPGAQGWTRTKAPAA